MSDTAPLGRVGLVIPTLNGGRRWAECLHALRGQSLRPDRLLNIDSESNDDTVALARSAGFEVRQISRAEFNHGGTRQWAVEYLDDCEIVVLLTQDAVLASCDSLAELVSTFRNSLVAVAYGRQLPHVGATPIESHARDFGYGPQTLLKDAATVGELGTRAFFCSNSFAAYRRSLLIEVGGFNRDLILGEDMEFAARAIQAGYANVYCATATVFHSHDYTLEEIVARYFDIGVFDAKNLWMREQFGSHEGQGLKFIASEFKYLAKIAPLQIPRAGVQNAGKLIGYRLGRLERLLPNVLKRRLSMLPGYFR